MKQSILREAFLQSVEVIFSLSLIVQRLEQLSNDGRKSNSKASKAVISTNHNRSKNRCEPIRIPSNYQ